MASISICAAPYAQAAYQFAKSTNQISAWEDALFILKDIMALPEAIQYIDRPSTQQQDILTLLLAPLQKAKITKIALTSIQNFIKLLLENQKLPCLSEIHQQFMGLKQHDESALFGEIITTQQINQTEIKKIQTQLNAHFGKKIDFTTKLDPSILGGIMIKIGDQIIDGSLRGQLDQLATELRA